MPQDLSHHRKNYSQYELLENQIPEDPITLFRDWFMEAEKDERVEEANAMSICTLGVDGFPKSRMVLLKKYTYEGFVFYTNYLSEKGKAIAAHPKVSLLFFWQGLERQILIKGEAEKLAENLSDGYFEQRPRGSQLGAWASEQSTQVPSREYLDDRLQAFETQYYQQEIPRPPHWGGYLVRPAQIEFWQGRPNRMHDRIRYELNNDTWDWEIKRLAP